ncbi:acyl-CoA dehydrogenase family protein [Ruminiclostridium cellobioparum]|jgi:glutaryl-CoA dehydrogenase (non-decarboxylating)|uniref:acyl-CoA dehydrogenase family protein n=1 Tax=Ruminiclostridium cellobioparum TaxID=29355 RepID=UPI0028AD89EB|nr:acyl-CoA dehydrogenase family protein [Ruminiclostridium cellobioparum]
MIIELTSEQKESKEMFREFTETEVIPNANRFDAEEHLSEDIISKMSKKGYLGSIIPRSYGGSEMDNITVGILNEELGRGCSSVRSVITVHSMVALAILKWGNKEQREYWLPQMASGEVISAFGLTEPNIGSDAKSIETTARLDGDTYILNGSKKWISLGQIAKMFLIFAQYEGKPTAFLIEKDRPGLNIKPISGLLGVKASMVAEVEIKECRIPKENLLGREGVGLSHVALNSLDLGRYTIAWGCVGLAQACLEECIKYSRKRKQFGQVLRQHQLIQKIISEMVVNVKAARLLCLNAGYLKSIGDPDSIMETWNAKYFASKTAYKVSGDAVQVHGANGCINDNPVSRFYRDSKVMEIIEGTSQMHEVLIAMNAFRSMY